MELELVYNEETQKWEQKPEPFITIECETEEDFEFIGTAVAFYKKHLEEQEKPQTNADRIRAMSDDELAEFLACANPTNCIDCAFSCGFRCQPDRQDYSDTEKCVEGKKRWLKQPAEVE